VCLSRSALSYLFIKYICNVTFVPFFEKETGL
jgi:hypothetical protein